jgi:hypothetical protein
LTIGQRQSKVAPRPCGLRVLSIGIKRPKTRQSPVVWTSLFFSRVACAARGFIRKSKTVRS